MKRAFAVAVVICFSLLHISGCATPSATKTEASHVPSFEFTPPSTAAPGSAAVTFAIVNASYSENQPWTQAYPFNEVSRNMALDFQEILAARGFTVRGPFGTYDEITFPDKKGSDLVLQPTLEIRLEVINPKYRQHVGLLGPDTYTLEGEVVLGGRVTFSLLESLSKERMWFKSVELTRSVIPFEGEKEYSSPPSQLDLSDPAISKSLGDTMEQFYAKAMQASWNYVDPEEMRLVKKQAEEIKKKKVY